jgi:hypothetical protein
MSKLSVTLPDGRTLAAKADFPSGHKLLFLYTGGCPGEDAGFPIGGLVRDPKGNVLHASWKIDGSHFESDSSPLDLIPCEPDEAPAPKDGGELIGLEITPSLAEILLRPAPKYHKTALIDAIRIDRDFYVQTIEGTMQGRAGDYLARGVKGELWPIAADVFAATYQQVAPTETEPAPVVHPISAEHPPNPGDRVEFASGLQAVVRRVVDSPKHPNEICEVEAGSQKESWLCETRTFRRIAHAGQVPEQGADEMLSALRDAQKGPWLPCEPTISNATNAELMAELAKRLEGGAA